MKMILKAITLSLLIIMSTSCSQSNIGSLENNSQPDTFYIPEELIKTDILRIFLPKNRPNNMSIMAPDGKWFVIQNSEDKIETISKALFENSNTIEFKVSKLEGVFWNEGKKMKGLVFKDRGKYMIYFADNMETEPENTFSFRKIVTY